MYRVYVVDVAASRHPLTVTRTNLICCGWNTGSIECFFSSKACKIGGLLHVKRQYCVEKRTITNRQLECVQSAAPSAKLELIFSAEL